ncbi:MAG: BatD family protein [Cellulophaga sp.]
MYSILNKYITIFLLVFVGLSTKAQDKNAVTFEVKFSKQKLGVNERLRVDFVMNKDGDNFKPPTFTGFRVLMGPSQSISSYWVNGVRSFSKTYSYTLTPTGKGKFRIDQATIVIKGKIYKTLAKEIEVVAAVDKPNGQVTANDVADENLHLVAEVSKSNPYLNERVSVVYKLYIGQSINVSGFNAIDSPKYNNFWSQDIPVTKYITENGTYKGKPYRYVILKRVVLYPQKTGKLIIEPLSLDISAEVPTSRRDFFGRNIYAQANKTVSAGRRTIIVRELPVTGKPGDFGGAVGEFSFKVTTSKTHLNASESLQAKVEVKGKGNLKLFALPEPSFPSSLEVYDPEYDEKVRTNLSGTSGRISNSYTIVPSFRGKYPIPSIVFSYFNPKTEKYVSLDSKEIVINVIEGPINGTKTNGSSGSRLRQVVETTGDQFNFIMLQPNLRTIGTNYFFGSTRFYLWLLLPLLLIPLAIIFGKKRDAIASDVVGNKIKKANKLARKYLSAAKKTLGEKEAFYIALEKALHNYLKAKLKIETAEFSKDKIVSILEEKKVDTSTTEGFLELLKNCEMARYSPFSEVQMQEDYDKASSVISKLDKQL